MSTSAIVHLSSFFRLNAITKSGGSRLINFRPPSVSCPFCGCQVRGFYSLCWRQSPKNYHEASVTAHLCSPFLLFRPSMPKLVCLRFRLGTPPSPVDPSHNFALALKVTAKPFNMRRSRAPHDAPPCDTLPYSFFCVPLAILKTAFRVASRSSVLHLRPPFCPSSDEPPKKNQIGAEQMQKSVFMREVSLFGHLSPLQTDILAEIAAPLRSTIYREVSLCLPPPAHPFCPLTGSSVTRRWRRWSWPSALKHSAPHVIASCTICCESANTHKRTNTDWQVAHRRATNFSGECTCAYPKAPGPFI